MVSGLILPYWTFISSSSCYVFSQLQIVDILFFPRPLVSQFNRSVVSNSLRSHGLQHARLPCPSSTPRTYSNSCPSSRWCHPTILSSVVPFSSSLQSFPASGSFQMSHSSYQMAKVLEFQLRHQSFQRTPRTDFL